MGGGRDSGRERRRGRGTVKGIGKGGETDERRRAESKHMGKRGGEVLYYYTTYGRSPSILVLEFPPKMETHSSSLSPQGLRRKGRRRTVRNSTSSGEVCISERGV